MFIITVNDSPITKSAKMLLSGKVINKGSVYVCVHKNKKITLLAEKINETRDQLLYKLIQTQQNRY